MRPRKVLASIMLGGLWLTALAPGSSAFLPAPPPQAPGGTAPSASTGSNSQAKTEGKTASGATSDKPRPFMGTVLRRNGIYVLRAGDLEYKLDDPDRARRYLGQSVKILGTLDKPSNTLHTKTIERSP
jgi:hypothetical protein